jgi:sortase A
VRHVREAGTVSPPAGSPAPPLHGRVRRRGGLVSSLVGFVGELLITAGVFLGLFVVWQLWWTDVQAERIHTEVLAELEWTPPPVPVDDGPLVSPEYREDPPVMAEPPNGEVFAEFYVPRWGEDYVSPVAQGVDKATVLDRLGIGHYPGTAMPGDLGNFAVAGHRTTYGKPFHLVADLREGDALVVRTEDTWYVYRMTSHQIVWPNQVEVVSRCPGSSPVNRCPS